MYFFRSWDGLGSAVLILLLYILVSFTHWKDLKAQSSKKWFLLSSAGIALSIAVMILRANDFVQTIAVLTGGLLLVALWNSLQANQPGVHSFSELIMTPFSAIRNYGVGLARFFLSSKDIAKPAAPQAVSGQKLKSIFIGIVISIPIIIVVTALLAAGDPIFQATLKDLFSFNIDIDPKIGQRILLSVLFLMLLIPLVQRKLGVPFNSPLSGLSKYSLTTEYSVVMLLLTVLVGFFLVVQWQYIFVTVAAETDLSKFGVATYSDYVTRGFAELQLVSVILYSLVWIGLVLIRANETLASAKWLKFIQLVLLAEFGVFLLSLFRRVWLYQSLHGMTVVRAYGAFFVLVVSMFALTLAGRHLAKRSVRWVQIELAIMVLAVFLLSVNNVEQYLAVSHPPTVNNRIDHLYISRLSADGVAGWQRALSYADATLNDPIINNGNLLTTDQRREVAYAGAIVKVLQLHRHSLIVDYGTAEELNQFYLASLSEADNRYTNQITAEIELNGSESATAASLLTDREKLRQLRGSVLNLTSTVPTELNNDVGVFFYSGNTECDKNHCFLSFFNWVKYSLVEAKIDETEQVLKFNLPAYLAYQRRDSILPMAQLLQLEDRYFELQNRIQTQPESERDFNVDIDFYSPFISDL
jgi:hypothetical protein